MSQPSFEFEKYDGLEYLNKMDDNSIDLILTDPPYIISRESGMNTHYKNVKKNESEGVTSVKTNDEWEQYKQENNINDDKNRNNFLQYGTIYGKKYCVKTDYGDWDSQFTMEKLDEFIKLYYKKLRKGGTLIIFFDLWKITQLKETLEKHKYKQLRFIEWIKTNPQPLNSKTNYLTNCREIAMVAVKGGKPTFNSQYDDGIYRFPLQGGKNRFHPTQKSLPLFEALIEKHSNPGDLVVDTFIGGGTTLFACQNTGRSFKGCDMDDEYINKVRSIYEEK